MSHPTAAPAATGAAGGRWMRFWFEPASPVNLGVCRILFFGGLLWIYRDVDFSGWGAVSGVFWMPSWLFTTLNLPAFPAGTLVILQGLWRAALATSCLGLATRLSTAVAFALALYLLGLPHNFGHQLHSDGLIVTVLGILALSRCGDALSLDRLLAQAWSSGERRPAGRSGEYTWPVRTVWLTMALVFFAAGVSKLVNSGADWVLSDNLAIMLVQKVYYDSPQTSWGLTLAQYPWLCRFLMGVTLVGELAYPLALVSRRARWLLVPSLVLIQVGIRLVLGPDFKAFLVSNVFWVPWERLGSRISGSSLARRLRGLALPRRFPLETQVTKLDPARSPRTTS